MYSNQRISVFGGRDITPEVYEDTLEIGRRLADEGYLVFCGGGAGVMEAIAKGVHDEGGIVVGVLKGQDLEEGNKYLTVPIATGIGIARNAILAYNCDAAIAISGQYGTLSEIAYAFQLKKPVIGYKTWDIDSVVRADSPSDVVIKLKKELKNV
ncbi:MAG: TIGR00725 family protein [Candidatus Neomarinimicrobiota bacterium]|nr:TIGR00725 family protein [Candidatus Neomarinimicrobiota bacterium]|tara:strand:- start:18 stop:479 length:462 start_codon:yes stop_codon:yes gene_type:complete